MSSLRWEDLGGSGLRAAAALGPDTDVRLVTAIDDWTSPLADAVFRTYGVTPSTVERDRPVGFQYFTPVSPPSINGVFAEASAVEAEDEIVLLFGMVEAGPRRVHARRLVVDPQRPRDLVALELEGVSWDEISIVANVREVFGLAQGADDLEAAALAVRKLYGAAAVVVKGAARGCLVVDGDGTVSRVGPYPTRSVWPLGSGDVFAAAYAHAWSAGASPVEAARVGSSCAAWWCATRSVRLPAELLDGSRLVCDLRGDADAELVVPRQRALVYLAGPFFTLGERWLIELARSALLGLGAEVFSPLHDVGVGGDEVAVLDLEGLDRADGVLALLDGWDPGTLYEAGWSHHKGLPVVCFLHGMGREGAKMLVGSGAELHDDLSSALYRAVWAAQARSSTATKGE